MKVILSQFATKKLKEIYSYYSCYVDVEKAKEVKGVLLASIMQLIDFLFLGQKELSFHSRYERRYLLTLNYKILYEIVDDSVVVLDIFHTKQLPHKMYLNEEPSEYVIKRNI
ncbi:type II toxin-antitoxin system RelE/ParE family toxin [Myroides marinus]|uniref:type II toxin-antitoxin system RelE/ParE family toxin n=1 Tax=Myroides marinus TaxID=703342 RepID=UPI00257576E3|nr:type II toxin-antitoxin system RelE/ParE family toxin [Myroides marinus]MDM1404948.1 type II toxin-antitoxin system RelE/ParE family toxin [Myroides marinus]